MPLADELLPFAERAVHEALEVLSPTRCAGCERAGALICQECLASLTLVDPRHSCTRCGAPFGDLLCTECSVEGASSAVAKALDRCLACAVYAHPLPRIIKAYKDAGERRLAPYLAELLYDTALHAQVAAPDRYGGVLSGVDAVAFVPATAAAFRRRGFDHMEAIARSFCDLSGVPLVDALVKYGHGDQRELGRAERREHARDMYETVEDVRAVACCSSTMSLPRAQQWQQPRRSLSALVPKPSMASLSHAFGRGGFCGSEDCAARRADRRATGSLCNPDRRLGATHDARRAPANGLHQLEGLLSR